MADSPPIYRGVDGKGQTVLVTDPHDAPAEARANLEVAVPKGTLTREPGTAAVVAGLHVPSVAMGLVIGLLVGALVFTRKRPFKRPVVVRVAMTLAGIALLASLYFGFILRSAGLGAGALSSPAALVEEARSARDAANAATEAKVQAERALAHE